MDLYSVPVDPLIFTLLLGLFAIVIVYYLLGSLPALILAIFPFAVTQDLTAYHTSPLPLLFFTTYLLLHKKRALLAGLFIGLLYQSHLLSFIYWPLWVYLALRNRLNLWSVVGGFVLGILPFIISGPIQTFGIFVWILKQVVTGFSGASSGISTAYQVVLLPGAILLVGKIASKFLLLLNHEKRI